MSKVHYGLPTACGRKQAERTTRSRSEVDCKSCLRVLGSLDDPWMPRRLPQDALNDLAVDVVSGKTYLTNTEEGMRFSFGHMFMLMQPPMSMEAANLVGAVYAEMKDASPRGINGYRFFFNMRMLHVEDVEPLFAMIDAKRNALQTAGSAA